MRSGASAGAPRVRREDATSRSRSTLLGLGGFPASHPLCLGMMGMHGEAFVNTAIQEADLLLALRHALRRPRHRQARDLRAARQEDPRRDRPPEINKNVPRRRRHRRRPARRARGAARRTSRREAPRRLAARASRSGQDETRGARHPAPAATTASSRRARDARPLDGPRRAARSSSPTSASTRCGRRSTTSTSSRARSSPRAASARWASRCPRRSAPRWRGPDAEVWVIAGDGGFQMTAVRAGDRCSRRSSTSRSRSSTTATSGMVRQWQEFFYDKRYAATPMLSPDFVKLADAYGIPAIRVTKRDGGRRRRSQARARVAAGPRSSTSASRRRRRSTRWCRRARTSHAMIRRPGARREAR